MTTPSASSHARRRRVLIISPHFPPVNAPDLQRVRQSLPYYARCGWDAQVLAVAPDPTAQVLEPLLLDTLPPDVPVTRVQPLPLSATSWAGLRNLGWRSVLALARAGSALLARNAFDLVFFSTTQFACLPLGRYWLRRHGVPYIVDLQDPWVNDYYERNPTAPRPGGVKYQFARATAALAEQKTLASAAGILTVSPAYATMLRRRYSFAETKPIVTLPFGVEPRDYDVARRLAPANRFFLRRPGRLNVVSIGRGGADLSPALAAVLRSLRPVNAVGNAAEPSIEVHLVGTSYAAQARAQPQFSPTIAAAEGSAFCHEHPARVGYFEALRLQAEADAVLVLGSADASYAPSKLASALAAGRPVIAIAWRESAFARQVASLSGVHLLEIESDGTASEQSLDALTALWRALLAGEQAGPQPRLPAEWHAESLTVKQTAFFARVLSAGPVLTPDA